MSDIVAHLIHGRPISGLVGGQATPDGINAESEQPVKLRINWVGAQQPIAEKVPVKGFEMTEIKDDAMSFRNRALIQEVGAHDIEKFIGAEASIRQAIEEFVADGDLLLRSRHSAS